MGKDKLSREILDSLPNIIVITNGNTITGGNYSFLDFVNCQNIEEFKESHQCICELFIKKEGYIVDLDENNWLEAVKKNRLKRAESKVLMYNSVLDENRSYLVSYSRYSADKNQAIVSFTDITDMIRYRELLAKANKNLESIVEDRTVELVKANKKLMRNQKLLEQAERIANLGSWELNIKTKEFIWSSEMFNIYSLAEDFEGDIFDYFISIVHKDDRDMVLYYLEGNRVENEDFRVVIGSGEKYIACSSERIENLEGDVVKILGTHQDITEKISILKDKEEKEKLLIQQSKMADMGEMIGAIAHQWKQPLNTLGLLVQDIPDAVEFEEMDMEYANNLSGQCMEQVEYMNQTIEDFKNFFKPSSQKANFNVVKSVKDVISILGKQLQKFKVLVLKNYREDDEFIVFGFNNEFKQVLINIINNGKDVLLERDIENKEIEIEIFLKGKDIRILIKDNAGGIPPEVLPNIFTPYFSTKGEKGTGIGLQIAKTIIEGNMNGKIAAYNSEKGAVFEIVLRAVI